MLVFFSFMSFFQFSHWLGDEIVLLSTDYDPKQAEVTTVKKCDDCSANEVRINRKEVIAKL